MNKHIIHYDNTQFINKPERQEVGSVSNSIMGNVKELTRMQIYELLCSGKTVLCAYMGVGKERKQRNFQSQSVFMLDFDNDGGQTLTIEQALADPYIQDNASFIYKTLSYSDELQKFRVVFFIDEPLTDSDKVLETYLMLLDKYPMADSKCVDTSRLFFGGTGGIIINMDNTLTLPDFKGVRDETIKRNDLGAVSTKSSAVVDSNYLAAFKAGDLEGLKKLYGKKYSKKFKTRLRAIKYLRSLNIRELLGLPNGSFHSLIREDNKPSCSVFKTDAGVELYKDLGTDEPAMDIIGLSYEILPMRPYDTFTDSADFLLAALSVEVENNRFAFSGKEDKLLTEFIRMLESDSVAKKYPKLRALFSTPLYVTNTLKVIKIFKDEYAVEDFTTSRSKLLAAIPLDLLAERIDSDNNYALRVVRTMVLSGILVNMVDEDIPKYLLDSINASNYRTQKGYRLSIYTLSSGVTLEDIETNLSNLPNSSVMGIHQNHKTEVLEALYGEKFARRLTPHYYTPTPENDKDFIRAYQGFVGHLVKTKGYAVTEDVIAMVVATRDYCSEGTAHKLYEKYRYAIEYMDGIHSRVLTVADKKAYTIPIGDTAGNRIYLKTR